MSRRLVLRRSPGRLARKQTTVSPSKPYRRKRRYFFSALLVTDVVRQSSLLLVVGDEEFTNRIDYPRIELGIYELHGVVSRKKQLLPYLTHCLREAGTKA